MSESVGNLRNVSTAIGRELDEQAVSDAQKLNEKLKDPAFATVCAMTVKNRAMQGS
jgi:hypothetical protein